MTSPATRLRQRMGDFLGRPVPSHEDPMLTGHEVMDQVDLLTTAINGSLDFLSEHDLPGRAGKVLGLDVPATEQWWVTMDALITRLEDMQQAEAERASSEETAAI